MGLINTYTRTRVRKNARARARRRKEKKMKINTERGIIEIEKIYEWEKDAKKDGYRFAFTVHNVYLPNIDKTEETLNIYRKIIDNKGLKYSFAILEYNY